MFTRVSLFLILAAVCAACANLSGEPPIVATILPATALPPTPEQPPDQGFPADKPDLAAGARLFADNCAACHGETGRGDGPVALANPDMKPGDFNQPDSARSQSPHEWFSTITEGRIENLMPPWGNVLTEQQRWDVAYYTYTLHYTPDALALGERIFQDCADCHGPEGRGDGPQAETLRKTVKDLTDLEAMSTLSDESIFKMVTQGFEDIMPSYADLSEAERRAVVDYARTLSLQNVPALSAPTATPVPTTTDSLNIVTGTALLLQIHAAGDRLEIVQALRVQNSSETLAFSRSIPLPDGTVAALAFTLPDGAVLNSSNGVGGIADDGRSAYVLDPIPPLSEQLYALSYSMPYSVDVPVSIPLDVVMGGAVRVLVRPLEMRVRSDQLTSMGEQTLGTALYNGYGAQLALPAGSSLTFTLQGTPDTAPTAVPGATPVPVTAPGGAAGAVTADVLAPLLAAAVVILVAAIVIYALRSRSLTAEQRIMQIARKIGEIDAAHKAGTLNHDLWHKQRAELKAEQMELRGFGEKQDE